MRLSLDDGSTLELAAEVVAREAVAVGDPLDDAERARLSHADLRWRAREACLALLAYRPRTRRELRDRLLRKGFTGHVAEACLEALSAQGLVDDDAFARSFVRDRLRLRPRGSARLEQELRRRGVAPGTARDAVEAVFVAEDVREDALAVEAAHSWLKRQPKAVRAALSDVTRSPARERARRRLHAFLARRGFLGAAARQAAEAARAASEMALSGNQPGRPPYHGGDLGPAAGPPAVPGPSPEASADMKRPPE